MTEIISLAKKRKAKVRAEKETRAAENRLKYGRTKQQKLGDALRAEKFELHMRAHKRETTDD